MIVLTRASVAFQAGTENEVLALDDVCLSIPPGTWLTIAGPNGSGKSTLLKVLAGDVVATRGSLTVDGDEVTDWSVHRRAATFQFVEQEILRNLVPSMTVEENLTLTRQSSRFPTLGRSTTSARRAEYRELLRSFDMGLEQCVAKQVRHLSGGQQAAIVVAKQMLRRTPVLLLDEFTASLDPRSGLNLLGQVQAHAKRCRQTVLMVSHDVSEMIACREDIVFMNRGKLFGRISRDELTVERIRDMYADAVVASQKDVSSITKAL